MLQWFRARAASIATTAMLAMAAVGGSAVVPHADDCHDVACGAPVEHDAAAHRIGATPVDADNHPLHCVVCHWVRAFRPGLEERFVSAPHSDPAVEFHADVVTITGRAPVAQPPLRSPPPSPAFA
jgi:hypothetical protein